MVNGDGLAILFVSEEDFVGRVKDMLERDRDTERRSLEVGVHAMSDQVELLELRILEVSLSESSIKK